MSRESLFEVQVIFQHGCCSVSKTVWMLVLAVGVCVCVCIRKSKKETEVRERERDIDRGKD